MEAGGENENRNQMLRTRENRVFLDLLQGRQPAELSEVDQAKLFELFQRHRLLSTISNETLDALELAIGVKWREEIKRLTLRSMHLTAVLEGIIVELTRKKLEVYSIKGPVLSQRLFGDIGKRHYGDLDLVVKRDEFIEVVEVLEGMDYKIAHPSKTLNSEQWDYYFKYKKDVSLINRTNEVVVELHLDIFRQELIRSRTENFSWEGLVEERIGAVQVKCLDLNTSFLYLIYHGGQHQYFRLFWLNDIAEAIKKWDLDHHWILDQAIHLGIDRLLGMGLLLSREFFGTNIPSEYEQYLISNRPVLLKLKKICNSRILGPEKESRSWKIRRYRFVLLLQPGIRYAMSILTNIKHRRYIRKELGGF